MPPWVPAALAAPAAACITRLPAISQAVLSHSCCGSAMGDQSLLSAMPSVLPGPAGGSLTLPGMKSLVVTGDLDPSVSFEAIAQAADEGAARQLGDVLRGLIALATLQASQKPELQQLASALTVTTEASRVRVNGRVTYELLDALQRGPAGRLAPASPAPAR